MAVAGQKRKKGEKTAPELFTTSDSSVDLSKVPHDGFEDTPKESPSKKSKPKKPLDSRFGGKTEEEIMQLFLPDHLRPGLDIVFVRPFIISTGGTTYRSIFRMSENLKSGNLMSITSQC